MIPVKPTKFNFNQINFRCKEEESWTFLILRSKLDNWLNSRFKSSVSFRCFRRFTNDIRRMIRIQTRRWFSWLIHRLWWTEDFQTQECWCGNLICFRTTDPLLVDWMSLRKRQLIAYLNDVFTCLIDKCALCRLCYRVSGNRENRISYCVRPDIAQI